MILHHLTVNTGDMARTSRADVKQHVIDHLLPLVDNEAGSFEELGVGFDIWRPLTPDDKPINGAAVFEISPWPEKSGDMPYVICVGAWTEDMREEAWERLREVYGVHAPLLRQCGLWLPMASDPPPVPFLGVILFPTLARLDKARAGMLGDMERCLFWAIAEGSQS